jgi:hypothetical protein
MVRNLSELCFAIPQGNLTITQEVTMNLKRSIPGIFTLLLVVGIFGCSNDDKSSPSYASCEVAEEKAMQCYSEWAIGGGMLKGQVFAEECYSELGFSEDDDLTEAQEAQVDACIEDKVLPELKPCVEKSGICGGADIKECFAHFEKECPSF